MTNAKILVVEDGKDLNELLEEAGIETQGGTLIPLVLPINSLDDIPVALENLSEHKEKVTTTIKDALEAEADPEGPTIDDLLEENNALEQEVNILKAKLEGVEKALNVSL